MSKSLTYQRVRRLQLEETSAQKFDQKIIVRAVRFEFAALCANGKGQYRSITNRLPIRPSKERDAEP